MDINYETMYSLSSYSFIYYKLYRFNCKPELTSLIHILYNNISI